MRSNISFDLRYDTSDKSTKWVEQHVVLLIAVICGCDCL